MLFRELASIWNISKSSLSDILAKYQDLELIRKCECNRDKRSIFIRFTSEATVIIEKLNIIGEEISNSILCDFKKKDSEIFENNIDKALKNVEKVL